jgi:hypothetical protein
MYEIASNPLSIGCEQKATIFRLVKKNPNFFTFLRALGAFRSVAWFEGRYWRIFRTNPIGDRNAASTANN